MKHTIHKAATRGHANHGWLDTYHTFSFANYYNPKRVHFGALRVLNDDTVDGGMGFPTHPHSNMEIISIPLSGDLEHQDSMGNIKVIKEGEIQVMSAGTGVTHSEYNKNADQKVKFLQIWIIPEKMNVKPRYDQQSLEDMTSENTLSQVVSPNSDDDGLWINQQSWVHLGKLNDSFNGEYQIKKSGNGVYAFVLEGSVEIDGVELDKRDGAGFWETDKLNIKSKSDSQLLLLEVPMMEL